MMRAFIFTVDAIFTLIVAVAATAILFYLHFSVPAGLQAPVTQAQSLAQSLMATSLSSISLAGIIPYAYATPFLSQESPGDLGTFYGNSYVFTPVLSHRTSQYFTISMWVMPATQGSGSVILYAGQANTIQLSYSLQGKVVVEESSGSGSLSGTSAATLPSNSWSHLAFVQNGTAGTLYINGVSAVTMPATYPEYPGPNLFIGSSGGGPVAGAVNTANFSGGIANVQLYYSSLSARQVGQLYKDGVGGFPVVNSSSQQLGLWLPMAGSARDYGPGAYDGISRNVGYEPYGFVPFPGADIPLGTSLLQAFSALYANGQGAYASMMLSALGANDTAITVNGTLGSLLSVAQFNGATSYVAIPPINLNGTPSITIAAWVYPKAFQTDTDMSTILTQARGYYLQLDGSGKVNAYLYGVNSAYFPSLHSIPLNAWSFVAFTYNGSSEDIYINGRLDASQASTGTITYADADASSYVGIGANLNSSGGLYGGCCSRRFDGSISNVQLYSGALPASRIAELYYKGIGAMPLQGYSLRGWWPLNGNAQDYSQNYMGGVSNGITYNSMPSMPSYIADSYQVSQRSARALINVNGTLSIRSIGVMTWR